MIPALAAIAIAGAVIQGYGTYKGASAQADAYLLQAEANRLKAIELRERNVINNKILLGKSHTHIGKQAAQIAGSGATIGSRLALLEDTARRTAEQIKLNNRKTDFEARAIESGASSLESSAEGVKTAGTISALGGMSSSIGTTFLTMD